eukprot:2483154-Prymnesium_polylepis.1
MGSVNSRWGRGSRSIRPHLPTRDGSRAGRAARAFAVSATLVTFAVGRGDHGQASRTSKSPLNPLSARQRIPPTQIKLDRSKVG